MNQSIYGQHCGCAPQPKTLNDMRVRLASRMKELEDLLKQVPAWEEELTAIRGILK